MDQALGPSEDTPQRLHPLLLRLTGGGHPGDGTVPCSRPAPAPASSPGYCCLWALACPALWDALLGWPHLAYCPLRAAGHAGLFLTECRMSRRCLVQGRSDGCWLARCCPPHGDRNLHMVVPSGPETDCLLHAKLSTLVSLFRDHAAGPHPLLPWPLRALGEVGCWGVALLGSQLTPGPVTCMWPGWPGNRARPNLS